MKAQDKINDCIVKLSYMQRDLEKWIDKSDILHCDTLPEMPSEIELISMLYFRCRAILVIMRNDYNYPGFSDEYKEREIAQSYDEIMSKYERYENYKKSINEKYHRYWNLER